MSRFSRRLHDCLSSSATTALQKLDEADDGVSSVVVRRLNRERIEEGRHVQRAESSYRVGVTMVAACLLGEDREESSGDRTFDSPPACEWTLRSRARRTC